MLDPILVRSHFPALAANPDTVFFDNPGGTQVVWEAIQRMQDYYHYSNANRGGALVDAVSR